MTVAGGAGYEGVQQTREPTTPAKAVAAKVAPANTSHAKAVAAKVARVKQLPGKVAAKKADHAKAKVAKAAAKADTATKRARTPVPTGRPASSRSETAKLPGNNGRDESAPGLKKALGKTKRPLEGEAEPGKSAIAKLRPRPAAKPLREQPVRAKVAKPKLKPRRLVPLDRGRAPKN